MNTTLYSFFRSSASFRVRIALNLKNVPYETIPVHLSRGGGEQRSAAFQTVNPQMRVPALRLPDGDVLIQSLAIIDWLDETHPAPPFLPDDPLIRAQVRAVAQIIASDMQPLNNSGTLRYLRQDLHLAEEAIDAWFAHWTLAGFRAVEQLIRPGPYAFGDRVTLADICLVPQVANARRFKVPLDDFPAVVAVDEACRALPAFARACPENQPDAE